MFNHSRSAGYQYSWSDIGWWLLSVLAAGGVVAIGLFTKALPLIAGMGLSALIGPLVLGVIVPLFLYDLASQRLHAIDRSQQPRRWWAMQAARGLCLVAPLLLVALMAASSLAWPILVAAVVVPIAILVCQDKIVHRKPRSTKGKKEVDTCMGNPDAASLEVQQYDKNPRVVKVATSQHGAAAGADSSMKQDVDNSQHNQGRRL